MSALEGRVRGLGKAGEAIVETERGLVFAPGGLPGERVRVQDVRREGAILRARSLRVLDASPERVEPPCAIAGRCGGCPLMHGSERVQLEANRARVERALAKIPRASATAPLVIHGPAARLAYRRRARFAWARRGGALWLGFRERRAGTIADVAHCAVLQPALNHALSLVRARVAPHLVDAGEIQLALGEGGLAVLAIETAAAQPRQVYAALETLVAEGAIAGVALRAGGASVAAIAGDPREVGRDVEGRLLRGPPRGFSQAHEEVNAALGRAVLDAAGPLAGAFVLELYAGHGNLTLALAARASRVRAVEASEAAIRALRENATAHGLAGTIEAVAGDAAAYARGRPGAYEVVVLDPPRTGARDAIVGLAALRPARIVYVSCDPETLGRDLALLAARGFVLDVAEAFDMFPQTAHVETVVRMVSA